MLSASSKANKYACSHLAQASHPALTTFPFYIGQARRTMDGWFWSASPLHHACHSLSFSKSKILRRAIYGRLAQPLLPSSAPNLVAMLSLEDFHRLLPVNWQDGSFSLTVQLLPWILILSQLLVSLRRILRKISFSSYGLSLHSRWFANISFMTNAVGVIAQGYNKV
jgi:hypothetical protein